MYVPLTWKYLKEYNTTKNSKWFESLQSDL